jgi:hypothetical protein
MIGQFGRYLALAALLGGVAVTSAISLASLRREPDPAASKLGEAVRVIGYQVFPHRGPSFRVQGTRLKLVSNVVVESYDPQRVTSYGFRLSARTGGKEVWSADVFTQSRESKAGWDGARWKQEAAWGVEPISLTDERVMILDLPSRVESATLSLRLLGQPREALIRLFGDDSRNVAEREAAHRRLDASERDELIRSSTYIPWQLLSPEEQDARLTHRWLRMAALGDSGFDVTTRTIYVTAFRVAPPTESSEGIEVVRGHDAAINVLGPAQLTLAALTGTLDDFEISFVSAPKEVPLGGASGPRRLAPDAWGRFDVAAEPGTLVVRTDRVEPRRFKLLGPRESQIAADEIRQPPGELGPDRLRIPQAMAGANAAVVVPVRNIARMPVLGRGVRIDARVVASDWTATRDVALVPMSIAHVAGDGRKLRVDKVLVGGAISTFEQLSIGRRIARVSEPTSIRAMAAPGAVRLELTAANEVALRAYRWVPGTAALDPAYRAIEVPEHRWRYARLEQRIWYPMQASVVPEPVEADRGAELEVQVRLEPTAPSEPRPGLSNYEALVPEGHPEQQRAREPVSPDDLVEVLAAWPAGSVTKLGVGVERKIDFRETIASRPRVSWAADPRAVGTELTVVLDGTRIAVPIATSVGAFDLPRISPGVHRVVVEGAIREAWIDRPPADGGEGVSRDRRLYRLTDRLRVRVVRKPRESVHVYAIVYAPSRLASTAQTFVLTVDGGRPERSSGVSDKLTNPEVRTTLPEARRDKPAVLVDLNGQPAGLARSIGVSILPDLVGDTHTIELSRIGGGDCWVRFVTTLAAPKDEQPRTWTSVGGPLVEGMRE